MLRWKRFNLRWKPTSFKQHEEAEKKLLSLSKINYQQSFVRIEESSLEINTVKFGSGKQNLLLLHGYGSSLGIWLLNMKPLSELYTVYAIDLPGFGRSSRKFKLPDEKDSIEQWEKLYVNSLERWREQMKLERFYFHHFSDISQFKHSSKLFHSWPFFWGLYQFLVHQDTSRKSGSPNFSWFLGFNQKRNISWPREKEEITFVCFLLSFSFNFQ